jgi:hypothetical protein
VSYGSGQPWISTAHDLPSHTLVTIGFPWLLPQPRCTKYRHRNLNPLRVVILKSLVGRRKSLRNAGARACARYSFRERINIVSDVDYLVAVETCLLSRSDVHKTIPRLSISVLTLLPITYILTGTAGALVQGLEKFLLLHRTGCLLVITHIIKRLC